DLLYRSAHSLKSSSASLGALRLAALSQELEMIGRMSRQDQAPVAFAKLEAEYAAVAAELMAELEVKHP
ncbi:MAG: Hpt domain-containing protein, partial [Acidimicrobiia bacterium]